MKPIMRQLKRFRERFARAIDRGLTTAPESPNIYINNPNYSYQSGSGTITSNNHNIINIFNAGVVTGEVRSLRTTRIVRWLNPDESLVLRLRSRPRSPKVSDSPNNQLNCI